MGKEANKQSWTRFLRYCVILLITGVTALAWVSVLTFHPADPPATAMFPPPQVHNAAGMVGSHISYSLLYWLGDGSYMLLLFLSACMLLMLLGGRITDLPWRIVGVALMVMSLSAASHLILPVNRMGLMEGNILGIAVGQFLVERFAYSGSWLVLLVTFCVAVMLTADNLVLRLPGMGKKAWLQGAAPALKALGSAMPSLKSNIATATPRGSILVRPAPGRIKPVKPEPAPKPAKAEKPAAATKPAQTDFDGDDQPLVQVRPVVALPKPSKAEFDDDDADAAADAEADATAEKKLDKAGPLFKFLAPVRPAKPAAAPKPRARSDKYSLPPSSLLAEATGGYQESQEAQAEQKRAILQQTLDNFSVEARVVGCMTGPVISMFELSLAPGVKVNQIASLAPDIARALAVPGVRVVSPLPGRDTVGVEVPNLDKETVRLKELMQDAPDAADSMQLPLYLGKDAEGGPIVADLASMPHMLLAGTTGSGKSVCINAIITSLLLTRTPDEVRFILVDPKMVEMAAYEKVPHLLCPIINDMRKAEDILEWAASKMDERYELLKEAGVRNIVGYNQLAPDELYRRLKIDDEQEKAQVPTRLTYYVIIIDELADLIMTTDREVETHIIRIAQKARAVGIHLILATQRPSVNVVTGLIKSNMPCRISFRVASRQESRIVLDQNGADVLLGQGDMLLLLPGTSQLVRAQGTYVDEKEIRALVEHVRGGADPEYCQELMKLQSGFDAEGGEGERDPMFDEAVEIVLASQRGSVSLLQRRLQVGYSRASRIVDQMAEAGILGDYKGSQARECLLTLEDWQSLKSHVRADQSGASASDGTPTSS